MTLQTGLNEGSDSGVEVEVSSIFCWFALRFGHDNIKEDDLLYDDAGSSFVNRCAIFVGCTG